MGNPNLQIFREDTPTVEVGTLLEPIDFDLCLAGEVTALPYDLLLYNDKTGAADSADARLISLELLHLNVLDGWTSDGTGGQNQTMALIPIYDADIRVDGELWARVDEFAGSGPNLNVYTFDFTLGLLTFGDNIHGFIPPNGVEIEVDYKPNQNVYGKTIMSDGWISFLSNGVVSSSIDVDLEVGDLIDSTSVQIAHYPATLAITGVWDNEIKWGTNYYTGGAYNDETGVLTLGTALVGTPYVEYSYQIKDDVQGDFITFITGNKHQLINIIPKKNAKKISLRATIPATAETEGGVNLRIRLRVYYWY